MGEREKERAHFRSTISPPHSGMYYVLDIRDMGEMTDVGGVKTRSWGLHTSAS